MPNGHGEERDQWMMLQSIDRTVARIEQKLDDHVTNAALHQPRPCDNVKRLENRAWGAVGVALAAVAAQIWSRLQ